MMNIRPTASTEAPSDFTLLIARIRTGDQHALERLLYQLAVPLRRIADRCIGNALQSTVDAEDLVQGVAMILWNGLRSGKFEADTSQQLIGLARILLKRQAAKVVLQNKPVATVEFKLCTTLVDRRVNSPARNAEVSEEIQQLMLEVDKDERRILKLLLLNHSIAETARLLKLQPSTLRMRLIRLRIRVRKVHRDDESKKRT